MICHSYVSLPEGYLIDVIDYDIPSMLKSTKKYKDHQSTGFASTGQLLTLVLLKQRNKIDNLTRAKSFVL